MASLSDLLQEFLKPLQTDSSASGQDSLFEKLSQETIQFLDAIDWSQPWLQCLLGFHVACFILAFLLRNHHSALSIYFFVLVALAGLTRPLNNLGTEHWEKFSSANYFDDSGLFIVSIYAFPLIINGFTTMLHLPSGMVSFTFLTLPLLVLFAVAQLTAATSAAAAKNILRVHNKYRAKHQAPPLRWNSTLATYAQKWSNRCQFKHSKGDYGENLAYGYPNWGSAISAWYNEVKDYDYSNPGFSGKTGHFTQLVWKSTTEIGCGVKTCANLKGAKLFTCSYLEFGNIVSDDNAYFIENVLPPKNSKKN